MSRLISPEEIAVVQWFLDHPEPMDPLGPWACAPAELLVVGGCECGCCSVDFTPDSVGSRPIREAVAVFADRRQCGLILWRTDDSIDGLEVYDMDTDASHRLPTVAELRTWDQAGDASSAQ